MIFEGINTYEYDRIIKEKFNKGEISGLKKTIFVLVICILYNLFFFYSLSVDTQISYRSGSTLGIGIFILELFSFLVIFFCIIYLIAYMIQINTYKGYKNNKDQIVINNDFSIEIKEDNKTKYHLNKIKGIKILEYNHVVQLEMSNTNNSNTIYKFPTYINNYEMIMDYLKIIYLTTSNNNLNYKNDAIKSIINLDSKNKSELFVNEMVSINLYATIKLVDVTKRELSQYNVFNSNMVDIVLNNNEVYLYTSIDEYKQDNCSDGLLYLFSFKNIVETIYNIEFNDNNKGIFNKSNNNIKFNINPNSDNIILDKEMILSIYSEGVRQWR